jgi:hypothetical protein
MSDFWLGFGTGLCLWFGWYLGGVAVREYVARRAYWKAFYSDQPKEGQ